MCVCLCVCGCMHACVGACVRESQATVRRGTHLEITWCLSIALRLVSAGGLLVEEQEVGCFSDWSEWGVYWLGSERLMVSHSVAEPLRQSSFRTNRTLTLCVEMAAVHFP